MGLRPKRPVPCALCPMTCALCPVSWLLLGDGLGPQRSYEVFLGIGGNLDFSVVTLILQCSRHDILITIFILCPLTNFLLSEITCLPSESPGLPL